MLVEFRVVMPLSLSEYQRGQLYTVSKLSRLNSKPGEGVEIIANQACTDVNGSPGHFTHKVYHLGSKVPSIVEAMAPRDALIMVEKSRNMFPACDTVINSPFFESFGISIRTTCSEQCDLDNALNLTADELADRRIITLDIANDAVDEDVYLPSEDPTKCTSAKTGRGPLDKSQWHSQFRQRGWPLMCMYKVARIKFEYWGLQSTIENAILSSQTSMMLHSHKQIVCWMDEWFDLTLENIREHESETSRLCGQLMAGAAGNASSPRAGSTSSWDQLQVACRDFIPDLGLFHEQDAKSASAWCIPAPLADLSLAHDSQTCRRTLNAWPLRAHTIHNYLTDRVAQPVVQPGTLLQSLARSSQSPLGVLNFRCQHAAAHISVPSLHIPALVAQVYAHVMNTSGLLFSSAQQAAVWRTLPRPVSHHINTGGIRKSTHIRSVQMSDRISASGKLRRGSMLAAATKHLLGDDDDGESASDSDDDSADEADIEELWRWHPILMQALSAPEVKLPIRYWLVSVQCHGDDHELHQQNSWHLTSANGSTTANSAFMSALQREHQNTLGSIFADWRPPLLIDHPWQMPSISAHVPAWNTVSADAAVVAVQSSPASDCAEFDISLKPKFPVKRIEVHVRGFPDLRELLFPPPVNAELSAWMKPLVVLPIPSRRPQTALLDLFAAADDKFDENGGPVSSSGIDSLADSDRDDFESAAQLGLRHRSAASARIVTRSRSSSSSSATSDAVMHAETETDRVALLNRLNALFPASLSDLFELGSFSVDACDMTDQRLHIARIGTMSTAPNARISVPNVDRSVELDADVHASGAAVLELLNRSASVSGPAQMEVAWHFQPEIEAPLSRSTTVSEQELSTVLPPSLQTSTTYSEIRMDWNSLYDTMISRAAWPESDNITDDGIPAESTAETVDLSVFVLYLLYLFRSVYYIRTFLNRVADFVSDSKLFSVLLPVLLVLWAISDPTSHNTFSDLLRIFAWITPSILFFSVARIVQATTDCSDGLPDLLQQHARLCQAFRRPVSPDLSSGTQQLLFHLYFQCKPFVVLLSTLHRVFYIGNVRTVSHTCFGLAALSLLMPLHIIAAIVLLGFVFKQTPFAHRLASFVSAVWNNVLLPTSNRFTIASRVPAVSSLSRYY